MVCNSITVKYRCNWGRYLEYCWYRLHTATRNVLYISLFIVVFLLGDGANDVSMIQMADVGIGISGQEGMQVRTIICPVYLDSTPSIVLLANALLKSCSHIEGLM